MTNHRKSSRARSEHAVVIVGGGPKGLMLAGEFALAGVDVAIVERRAPQELEGSRGGGLHTRTIEVLDQRGIAERFIAQGPCHPVVHLHSMRADISDAPTRHPYTLGLWQNHTERTMRVPHLLACRGVDGPAMPDAMGRCVAVTGLVPRNPPCSRDDQSTMIGAGPIRCLAASGLAAG